jgi:hypothetical protein
MKSLMGSKHFDKLLLSGLFVATVLLCVHLIHKSDAGGDDMTFIIWAQTQAAMTLGALLALIKQDVVSDTRTETKPETKPLVQTPSGTVETKP